ncbi:hypothetical protein QOZ98_002603 [Planomicrobium stackebrandtii]|uniref:Uncharacterized protein n=1 Tax=Planomicrobium stackebrandtii TaxID=253160 RepID=A0ABU0GYX5_9BACL|nr:hypothetical protein [Planomicrobium stackebrandtii]MDQ0429775.1 hypothetical protein [Planomicrobium stackebrandtii]
MVNDPKEEERPESIEADKIEETEGESAKDKSKFDKIYSNIASNRFENLRTSHIENKAKELRKRKK